MHTNHWVIAALMVARFRRANLIMAITCKGPVPIKYAMLWFLQAIQTLYSLIRSCNKFLFHFPERNNERRFLRYRLLSEYAPGRLDYPLLPSQWSLRYSCPLSCFVHPQRASMNYLLKW